MGCLFPFLPLHMAAVGLTLEDIRLISMISPLVAIFGPFIVAPLADKLAARQVTKPSNGRYLRVMIALSCFLSAVVYSLLLLIPVIERIELPREHRPTLKFSCNQQGATVLQERNNEFSTCYNWTSESRVCAILLRNCNYACHPIVPRPQRLPFNNKPLDAPNTGVIGVDFESNGDTAVEPLDGELKQEDIEWRTRQPDRRKHRRYVTADSVPPHLCFNEDGRTVCHVYTNDSGNLPVNASFREASNARHKQEWCAYPIAEEFLCRIPGNMEATYRAFNQTCSIECDLLDPFMLPGEKSICAYCPDYFFYNHCRLTVLLIQQC